MQNRQKTGGLALVAALMLGGCAGGSPPLNLGLSEGRLKPCPDSPNCVSSQATAVSQRVEPLFYGGAANQAQSRLLAVLNGMERVHIQRTDPGYVHAEFRSALWGFVDDVEFQFEPSGVIQARSASRTGYYDFGVNRARIETIRVRFAAQPATP
jgi:uncharacterized protein (DUF1499 family)